MEQKAVRGVLWALLSYTGNRGITTVATLVLARLLTPADFGLVALAAVAVNALSTLGDFGLGNTLIVRQELSRRQQGTVFTVMAGLGVVAGVAAFAAAPLYAQVMGEARLGEVLRPMAAIVPIVLVSSFYEKLMRRELLFRPRFICQIVQAMTYAGVAIPLAATGAGVWSLVVGQIAGFTVASAGFLTLTPYRVAPHFDFATAQDTLKTGWGYLLQSALSFAQRNTDYLAVGRVLGAAPLGIYTMAYRLSELTFLAISAPVASATFPAFARMRERGEDPRSAYLSVLRLVAIVASPFGIIMSAGAEPITRALLGEQWLPMIAPLMVLGIWATFSPVHNTVAWYFNAVGQQMQLARISAFFMIPLVPALFFAAAAGGVTAVAAVIVARSTLTLATLAVRFRRRIGVTVAEHWVAVKPVVIACLVMWPTVWGASRGLASLPSFIVLVSAVAAGACAYVGALYLVDRRILATSLSQLRRVVTSRAPAAT